MTYPTRQYDGMITSLPFHLLIVHLAVVAIPVAALLTLTLNIRPTLYP
ncbi:hypothetical protein [Corynebacterium rouxii]